MIVPFDQDPLPSEPKILFIGRAQSTHTHAWIDLLAGAPFNVRLFALADGLPPEIWPVKTYITGLIAGNNSEKRKFLYAGISGQVILLCDKLAARLKQRPIKNRARWLADVIRQWQPDIIHTLGFFDDQGGLFYYETRESFGLQGIGKWILQTRGGSDLALRRHNPELALVIRKAFNACHQIISDNSANIRYAQDLGIEPDKFAGIVPVPGTGGVNVEELSQNIWPPSQRERIILWPKAYESQWSKALPVLEAIQLAWDRIQPCEVYMLAMTPDVREWFLALPEPIRQHCHIDERIVRAEVLSLMTRARVLLIPSLIDGIPNSLYEAMAAGAFPIVSPIETIQPIVANEKNVLFARNLYPEEIANALLRAMNDDKLVDDAAGRNLQLVHRIANRGTIAPQVVQYYERLARDAQC